VRPELIDSTLFTDLAESFQHLALLELSLRDRDGTLIPTAEIGFQDAGELLRLGQETMAHSDADGDADFEILEYEDLMFEQAIDAIDTIDDLDDGDPTWGELASELDSEWSPDERGLPDYERYQIHLRLA
jgi:hypothetical protein